MKLAYLDTSFLLALGFGEESGAALARRLERFDRSASSNFLEAELRAAFASARWPDGLVFGPNLKPAPPGLEQCYCPTVSAACTRALVESATFIAFPTPVAPGIPDVDNMLSRSR